DQADLRERGDRLADQGPAALHGHVHCLAGHLEEVIDLGWLVAAEQQCSQGADAMTDLPAGVIDHRAVEELGNENAVRANDGGWTGGVVHASDWSGCTKAHPSSLDPDSDEREGHVAVGAVGARRSNRTSQ